MSPMVHWPEVMMTYDTTEKIMFTSDAFGTFGTCGFDKLLVAVQSRKFGSRSGNIELQNYGIFRKIVCLLAREEQNKQRQNLDIFHINHIIKYRKQQYKSTIFFVYQKTK